MARTCELLTIPFPLPKRYMVTVGAKLVAASLLPLLAKGERATAHRIPWRGDAGEVC